MRLSKSSLATMESVASLDDVLKSVEDQYHSTLYEISNSAPTLVVFLRHFGCCFCKEALSDIHDCVSSLQASGVKIVLVHMAEEDEAATLLASYGLADLSRISSPDQGLYRYFGLGRGTADKILAPKVISRAFEALLHGHAIGPFQGDTMQMPGAFMIHRGRIVRSFVPESVEMRPDYVGIASGAMYAVAR
jgi:hypothetical protein